MPLPGYRDSTGGSEYYGESAVLSVKASHRQPEGRPCDALALRGCLHCGHMVPYDR